MFAMWVHFADVDDGVEDVLSGFGPRLPVFHFQKAVGLVVLGCVELAASFVDSLEQMAAHFGEWFCFFVILV